MQGHLRLIADLTRLLEEAKNKQFHDFEDTAYVAPKMALAERLRILRKKTLEGEYDN